MRNENPIISQAFELAQAVQMLLAHARRFYYEVVLSGYACPDCGQHLEMVAEGRCRCGACGRDFDPTLTLQRCGHCGGKLRIRICRYVCRDCGADVASRFLFDGLVFDRAYFRQRMAESRQRAQERHEHRRQQVAVNRSRGVELPAIDLAAVPGLVDALDGLTDMPAVLAWVPLIKGCDLRRYQEHVLAHLGPGRTAFDTVPVLDENPRLDRIWRFVAVIFLAHAGQLRIEDRGGVIYMVRIHETNRQRP